MGAGGVMDDYQDELSAVWKDPMEYDMQKHGPSYLPVTASQRKEARQFAERHAAFYDVPTSNQYTPLAFMLALLRAAYMIHQTAHWQTRGSHYYADHTLFQRIYEESLEGIDGTAERAIGLSEPGIVAVGPQAKVILSFIQSMCPGTPAPDPEALAAISLKVETVMIKVISETKARIEAAGGLTEGLDDMLQGLASKHEEFVYLLKQRSTTKYASYDRR